MNKEKQIRKIWTEKDISFLREHYPTKGILFCEKALKRKGYCIKTKASELKIKLIKKEIDAEKFIKMDCPESIYLAGMLWADGWIHKKLNITRIGLLSEDMNTILPIFRKFGDWGLTLYHPNNRKEQSFVYSYNKILYDFLVSMDYKDKSYTEPTKILNYIDSKWHYLFFRGFSDGDSCFYVSEKSHMFSTSGNIKYQWTELIKLFLNLGIENYSLQRLNRGKSGSSSTITISNYQAIEAFGNYIYQNYENDRIGFERKYSKFNQILEKQKRKEKPKISLTSLETSEELTFEMIKDAAKFLDCDVGYLGSKIKNKEIFRGYKCAFKSNNEVSLEFSQN